MKLNPPSKQSSRSTPPSATRLEVTLGRDYVGGYQDDVIEELATEDGEAAAQNSSVWGDNTHPHTIDLLNSAHDAATGLVAHGFRGQVQEVVARMKRALPVFSVAQNAAMHAVDAWKLAMVRELTLRHKILSTGLSLPAKRDAWKSIGALTVLFAGEWPLIAVSYQILGLSDRPLIPGLSFTDDLHLAALATVGLLVALAHGAGTKLRRIEFAHEMRRNEIDHEAKAKLPRPSRLDLLLLVLFLGVALAAVWGVGIIRLDYLAMQGVAAQAAPFLVIQLGILCAAVFLSYHFANPFDKEWKAQRSEVKTAAGGLGASLGMLTDLAGGINADIALVGALTAQAGHHVRIDEANAKRQGSLFARRVILAQRETTTDRLLPESLSAPRNLDDAELLMALLGVSSIPTIHEVSVEEVAKHHTAAIEQVRIFAERVAQVEIDHVLGHEGSADDRDESENAAKQTLTPVPEVDAEADLDGEVAA